MGIESIIASYETIKQAVDALGADVLKAASGNAAAGARVRKGLKTLVVNSRSMRKATLEFAKAERAVKAVEPKTETAAG